MMSPSIGPRKRSLPTELLGWEKLDKYYRLTENSFAYVAAIALHPSLEWW